MDLGGPQESDITMPISVNYGPIHESSKFKMLSSGGPITSGAGAGGNGGPPPAEIRPSVTEPMPKKAVKYRECLKNHAAAIGGHALDGCGEFMPSGEDGTLEALKCAACNCHRNFHRKEVEGEPSCYCFSPRMKDRKRFAPLTLPPHTPQLALPSNSAIPARPNQQMIMALGSSPNDCEDQEMGMMPGSLMHHQLGHPSVNALSVMKKRFRTKFTAEQKEKMFAFAEKLGWRIQKHDEAAVQQFCVDAGVKRHVLKVWMHNNKHTFGKKMLSNEIGVGYLDNGGSPTNSSGMHA